jgi:hypothetical protein
MAKSPVAGLAPIIHYLPTPGTVIEIKWKETLPPSRYEYLGHGVRGAGTPRAKTILFWLKFHPKPVLPTIYTSPLGLPSFSRLAGAQSLTIPLAVIQRIRDELDVLPVIGEEVVIKRDSPFRPFMRSGDPKPPRAIRERKEEKRAALAAATAPKIDGLLVAQASRVLAAKHPGAGNERGWRYWLHTLEARPVTVGDTTLQAIRNPERPGRLRVQVSYGFE